LALFLVELLLLAEAYRARTSNRYKYFLGAMLAAAGVSFFWSFLLPVAVAAAGLCILQSTVSGRKLPPPYFLVGFVLLSWLILFQPIMQAAFVVKLKTDVPIINMPGNVVRTEMYSLVVIFLGLSAYVYFQFKSKALGLFYTASAVTLAFSLALMAYQLSTIQELRYYYFKSNFTYISVAIIMLAAIGGDIARRLLLHSPIKNSRRHGIIICLSLCIISLGGFLTLRSSSFDDFLYNRMGGVSAAQADAISNVMSQNTNAGVSLLPIGSCNRGDDIRAAQLAHALIYSPATTMPSVYGYLELSYLDKEYLFEAIRDYTRSYDELTILSSDLALSGELRTRLGPLSQKVQFVELDATAETEPAAQCPDRVRALTDAERAGGLL